ncbi:MAG: aminotransferase class I/II-fold pyridoxal phosphate-dependent enzyme [Gammaproteobacteria bacterium]|nr:aminotransferase class I/II-fold pyridoxal phosphate-dependent enzyme [Gammaproteobacteria bacterium]MBU2058383.1 aminotransferase class I/II-fold pyridoxal phosphate-dependent enzyme [Gammaproteobacteria bacterium]MBU2176564.1 aminotransferase class I/II-fold pyridoxal phosphate-dependent enzyme [Gammaproteobacteria bacterium]MBU2248494.1 aminotransferase class I/II-fold pyridoxal phosphate-dependent enzyme [Gammaproteobacteria bacterium]MBU2345643.1 aminotransferase class I/II-fold pyridox
MIPHNRLQFSEKDKQALLAVVDSGFYTMGAVTAAFEQYCQSYYGYSYAVAVSSGSMALRLALIAAGVQTGDSVIVPAYSCSALSNVVMSLGAVVVPVDIQSKTPNIDAIAAIRLAKQHGVKVVIAVNTFGQPADIKSMQDAGLVVIEDCSHGFHADAEFNPVICGDLMIQSFYATKLFGAAELGLVLTNDPEQHVLLLNCRSGYSERPLATCLNVKPDEFNTALALSKLKQAPEQLRIRQKKAQLYLQSEWLKQRHYGDNHHNVWYRFVIRCVRAEQLITLLQLQFGLVKPVSPWLDDLSLYPCAELAYKEHVSIPLYPDLLPHEQQTIVRLLTETPKELWSGDNG